MIETKSGRVLELDDYAKEIADRAELLESL